MRITILGATGSVGRQTATLIRDFPDRFSAVTLVAGRDVAGLAELSLALRPQLAVIADESLREDLQARLQGSGIDIAAGRHAVIAAASEPEADLVVGAMTGLIGLEPCYAALCAGRNLALANKETLVCAGELMLQAARDHQAHILPLDSEHNALFQLLEGKEATEIKRLILTASGGPFRNHTLDMMAKARPQEALRHPNWQMGAKISIDSATMMNKGLELIEARHLFGVEPQQLAVIVHPQSIIHSLIELTDGSMLAHLGVTDMRGPIAHCLAWPERLANVLQPLDLALMGKLEFAEADETRFPSLRLAREAMITGGIAPIILNAANEVAVALFLEEAIGFTHIPVLCEGALNHFAAGNSMTTPLYRLEDILALDQEVRAWVKHQTP